MSYHMEERSYPEFEKEVAALPGIIDQKLACPRCGKDMRWCGDCPDERYMRNGTFESEERYYCDNCGTFADVTQVYAPTTRKVKVMQDVFDD